MATVTKNGAYDTLIIRKDPKFGNKWCIYQDGNSNRMVQRVFDSPEWAKKYIKEDLPAWKDAKIRVKNSCTSTNPVVQNAMAGRVAKNAEEPSDYEDGAWQSISSMVSDAKKLSANLKKAASIWSKIHPEDYGMTQQEVNNMKASDTSIAADLDKAVTILETALRKIN